MGAVSVDDLSIQEAFEQKCAESRERYARALELFPGGATRSARGFATWPLSIDRASGSRIWDADGNEYIDYYVGLGSTILGHAHPLIVEAIQAQLERGTQYGLAHDAENQWAGLVAELVPSCQRIRFTNSGSESTYIAIRLARAFTGREKILKFEGHYHGWYDSGTVGTWEPYEDPPIGGISPRVLETVDAVPPGRIDLVRDRLASGEYAGVILEPTGGKSGMFPIAPEFVASLRELCDQHGALLLYDEIVTGFRVSPGGFQAVSGILPDICGLAKALAGGLPCGAVVGRAEVFESMGSPGGSLPRRKTVVHSGTFNGNPISAAAGIATLTALRDGKLIAEMNRLSDLLGTRLNGLFAEKRLRMCAYGSYSMPHVALSEKPFDLSGDLDEQVLEHGITFQHWPNGLGGRLSHAMLLNGVNVGRSIGMLSVAHTEKDVLDTVAAYDRALDMLIAEGDLAEWRD